MLYVKISTRDYKTTSGDSIRVNASSTVGQGR